MKLQNLNRLDEALELNRQRLVVEGLLDDFVTAGIATAQRWMSSHQDDVKQLGFGSYVKSAKNIGTSLLDDSPEADEWWQGVITAIDRKLGSRTSKKQRLELIAKVKAKIDPVINRDLENVKEKLMQSSAGGHSAARKLLDTLFDDEKAPAPKRQRKTRRQYAEESVCREGLGDLISNALDMLDPKKRVIKGASLIRASNNARIAAIAISMLSQHLDSANVARRLKAANRKPPVPKTPLTRKYEMAMFINKCMLDASKAVNKDKPQEFWVRRIKDKAKRIGMTIKFDRLPSKPYPKDFDEFRQKFGANTKPVKAEVVPEGT